MRGRNKKVQDPIRKTEFTKNVTNTLIGHRGSQGHLGFGVKLLVWLLLRSRL